MTRQDLFSELSDVIFAIVPSVEEAPIEATPADVESVRQAFLKAIDRISLKVAEDAEFTADDAADAQMEWRAEVGRD